MAGNQSGIPSKRNDFEVYIQVIRALVLRDMRTRFGGSHWGYAVIVLWPVAHVFLIVGVMTFRNLPSPMGNSPMLFVATGAVPCLIFQYASREVMQAILKNRPLIYYPQVKLFDLVVARFIVEIVKGFTALIVIICILVALGVEAEPADIPMAVGGYCAAILLGLGIGTINIGIVSFFPGWLIGYILVTVVIYITSGVFYLPNTYPDEVYSIMKWNPMVQIIEWVRLGYNPNMGVTVDFYYVIMWGMGSLAVGLIMERTVVRSAS